MYVYLYIHTRVHGDPMRLVLTLLDPHCATKKAWYFLVQWMNRSPLCVNMLYKRKEWCVCVRVCTYTQEHTHMRVQPEW